MLFQKKMLDPSFKESVNDLGFSFTILLSRMFDLDPTPAKSMYTPKADVSKWPPECRGDLKPGRHHHQLLKIIDT